MKLSSKEFGALVAKEVGMNIELVKAAGIKMN